MNPNRRQFLKTTTATSLASTLSFPAVHAKHHGGKKYRTALIGSGWWGMNILNEAMRAGHSKVVALCDVDDRQLQPAWKHVEDASGNKAKAYRDYREMLEKEKPEIVIVATPDHWHPLQTIAAVNAGAHVYVEKPISHTIAEGRAMVEAARATGKMVQVGAHRRVSAQNMSGMDFLRSGKAGKIGSVRCFVHYGGGREKPVKNTEPPKELDWDMWRGPAPMRHFCGNIPGSWGNAIHPKGFRNYLDYANGTLGDWGIHWLDQVLWWSDEAAPKRVFSTGGRPVAGTPVYTEEHQTTDAPDHQMAVYEFEDFTMTWEHRKFAGNNTDKGENVGCYFYGTEGVLHQGWRDGWTFYPNNKKAPLIHQAPELHAPDSQNIRELWSDFLASIDDKKRLPVCDIEIGHRSTTASLLGMLSLKLGRSVEWDGERERVVGDPAANVHLRRDYRGEWEYPTA
ncbi:MAG: Gfo/Idh/MocA family oxidoreductase [Verrucomicrobiaceae bacterium]|nr:Gfo/Idh/MocA family oxidoreductase [Verrucomicrobiaceae bacterium]